MANVVWADRWALSISRADEIGGMVRVRVEPISRILPVDVIDDAAD